MEFTSFIMRIIYKKIFPHTGFLYSFIKKNLCELSDNVVDLGSGPGLIHRILLMKGAKYVINIDIDYELLRKAPISSDKILASSYEKVLREKSIDHIVLHDALHHFEKPVETLKLYAEIFSECIHIIDFDSGKIGGKIIKLLEKIIGFPANFYSISQITDLLRREKLNIITLKGPSKTLSQYYIKACRKNRFQENN